MTAPFDGVVGVLRSLTAGHWHDRPAHIPMAVENANSTVDLTLL